LVMLSRFDKSGLFFAFSMIVAGCGNDPVPVRLDHAGVQPTSDVSDLAAVLSEAVTEDGRVKPADVQRLSDRLDSQLRRFALAGPTATPNLYPTDSSRWAYWYNARAAWSIKLAALSGFHVSPRPQALRARPFQLDGRTMWLEQIDQILFAESKRTGDFRLASCAPGVCASYAPLPSKPYSAADFEGRLDEALDSLVLDERRFVLSVEDRQVRVPQMLWACNELIIQQYQQKYGPRSVSLITAIRPHLGRAARRRLDEALGYAVVAPERQCQVLIPKRRIYYPGKVGRIEP